MAKASRKGRAKSRAKGKPARKGQRKRVTAPEAARKAAALRKANKAETLTYQQFVELARDPDVPERALRPYFTSDPKEATPMHPAVALDRTMVSVPPEDEARARGAFVMDWANEFSRAKRQLSFRARTAAGDTSPILVAEGDSWHQFPIFLDDVIDQLSSKYRIWSLDAAGDTLENMISGPHPEYLLALAEYHGHAKAFLLSGGGNDMVGKGKDGVATLVAVLRPHQAGKPASWYVDTPKYKKLLTTIEQYLRTALTRVEQQEPGLPVLLHGYDYAIPGPAPNEWRNPKWASVDQWLGSAFKELKIANHSLRRQIIKLLIDDLNNLQIRLCGNGQAGPPGTFRNAYHVDLRGVLVDHEWADELHPTDAGFAKVAKKFSAVLKKIGL
jgi:hypothetical protein